jgi:peptidoglycan/LPS O-acetylase OafA/YrhL
MTPGAKREDIPGLTGLRFVAALCVVIAHCLHSVQGFDAVSGLSASLSNLSGLGMSLFFVLSGFVIHYNYADIIESGDIRGLWSFFVARFSRLYPLYIVLLLLEMAYNGTIIRIVLGDPNQIQTVLLAAPSFLTLTQTWFYSIVGQDSIVYQFGRVGAISWSISTEWFFYLVYPVILLAVVLLKRPWAKFGAVALVSVAAMQFVQAVIMNMGAIDDYAVSHYGSIASVNTSNQNAFYRWVLYFSPYSRVTEFILGVLTCAIYLDFAKAPPSRRETQVGLVLSIAAVLALGITHFMLLGHGRPYPILTNHHMVYGYALPVALLIFCVARYSTVFTRLLATRPAVAVGEVSYSLYLVHFVVLGKLAGMGFMSVTPGDLPAAWGVALTACAAAIAISFVTYNLIEVPARWWFRRALAWRQDKAPSSGLMRGAFIVSRAGVIVCLLVLPLAIVLLRPLLL